MDATRQKRLDAVRALCPMPKAERYNYGIQDLKKGGVFTFNNKTFLVTSVATYTETNDRYTKEKDYVSTEYALFCLETGKTHYIEWGVDDEVEISFTERKIPRRELGRNLTYDDGEVVDLDDMDEIVEEDEDLLYNRTLYGLEDDWAAKFKADDGRSSYVYFYEFEDNQGNQFTVEAWSDTPGEDGDWDYEVFLSFPVSSNQIEIISLGGE